MDDGKKQGILGHLDELRRRITKSAIAIGVGTAVAFVFAERIFGILVLPAGDIDLVYVEMTEMIGTYFRVCLIAGVILGMPYLVYQILMFIVPGLAPNEKKSVYLIVPWIALSFVAGVIFGYFIMVPPLTRFLISFQSDIATPMIKVSNYVSVVSRLLLAIGIVFELPVITTFLAKIGIITPEWLASKRKIALIAIFVVAAIITPTPDPINQSLVAVPILILYEISILLAKMVTRKKKKQQEESSSSS